MTDTARVETMVRELIATGAMWPETIVEGAKAGNLSAEDERYLVAFHAKNVLDAPVPDAVVLESSEDWRTRAERAETRVAELEEQIRALTGEKS
jgi:hypothetical protein